MSIRTTVLAGTFAFGCLASSAKAQATAATPVGVRRANPPKKAAAPRVGTITQTPQPAPELSTAPTAGATPANTAQVAAFYYLPAVVLTDGRIFANINGRYEQILRRCPSLSAPLAPGSSVATCWTVDGNGRYSVVQRR